MAYGDDHRKLNPAKKRRANNTKSPRTRDGKTYPGGKPLRRALTRLAARKDALAAQKDANGYNMPGTMKP